MKRIITTLAALAVFAGSIQAADEPAKKPEGEKKKHDPAAMFAKKDKNNDGSLSKEEFTAGAKDAAKAEESFKKKDKDGDGKLSKEEATAVGKKKDK
jgi:hypothetical protein